MGVIQDMLDNAQSIRSGEPVDRYLRSLLTRQVDPEVPGVAMPSDARHTLTPATMTGGNFTLTFTLRNGETFTTGNIAFNASAATVETAINEQASGVVTGWTNGDISVTGGPVNGAFDTAFNFTGNSVSEANHPITVLNDVDGTGGSWGTINKGSSTLAGQSARYAMGVLIALGVLDDATFPEQSAPASNSAYAIASEDRYNKFPGDVLTGLAREMAAEDANNDSYHSLIASLGIQDKAPKAQLLGGSSVVGP